jgi:threonine dehydrogenase-like Zn-dependent dehydrogenase
MPRVLATALLCLGLLCLDAPRAEADAVHFLIPAGAGGGLDGTARAVGATLRDLGLVDNASFENMTGGGGARAMSHFVQSAPRLQHALLVNSTPLVVRTLQGLFPHPYHDLVPIVIDATGNKQSMINAFQYASHGGTVVYVGLVKDDIIFHHPAFHKKELNLLGSRNATRLDFENVIEHMLTGDIDAKALITHRFRLDTLPEQFETVYQPDNRVIKAIVEV